MSAVVERDEIPDEVRAAVLREVVEELIGTNRALTVEGVIPWLRDWADRLEEEDG